MGGDYEEVLSRLVKEERIEKYMLKFLDDTSFTDLCKAREEAMHEEVFRMIHTLKGVSQNLGFTMLYRVSDEMTEAVRGGVELKDECLFERVKIAYTSTINAILEYKNSL